MVLKRYESYLDYGLLPDPIPLMDESLSGNYLHCGEVIRALDSLSMKPGVVMTAEFRMGYVLAVMHMRQLIGKE